MVMKYYNIRQLEETDCAAACLATISMYYELDISISKLRDVCGTDIHGTNVNSLVQAATTLNFESKSVRIGEKDFNKDNINFPIIVHGITNMGTSHFIVVYDIKKNYMIIADPANNEKRMSLETFFKFYSGVCIFLKPNEQFVSGKTIGSTMLLKFIKLLFPHKRLFIVAIIASIILTTLGVVSNFFNQILIDEILPYNLKNQLTIFCIGFLIISFINIIIGSLRQHILLYLSQKIDIPLTLGYFKHIFSLPMRFFSTRKTGDILTRFQDAGTIKNVMSNIALSVLIDVTLVGVVGVVLYFMNPKLFIIIIILTVINIILVYIFKRPYKRINLIQMEQSSMLSSSMIESLQGVEMIKTNSIEDDRMDLIEENYIRVLKTGFKENVLSNVQGTISGAISTIGNIVLMWLGATLVMNGDITLGSLMAFTSMSGFFMDPIGRIVALQLQIQESGIAMKRLSEIYDVEAEKIQKTKKLVNLDGDIKFNSLTFKYTTRENVLKDVSFEITKGSKVAIVGESGSGKTTLSKLLFGLYEIDNGNITINDIDIKDIGLYNLRKRISYVSQNVNFFSGTIKENITVVNREINDEKIKSILKMAGCDFVFKMPAGIDTYLEEAGNNLSGGERQRLAFARALAKEFDVLVLDEATSNLDFISEARIYETLFNSNYNQTMIIIAHRLSTIRKCDKIIVLDNGSVAEIGSHDELLARKGNYYNLWQSQVGNNISITVKEPLRKEMKYE